MGRVVSLNSLCIPDGRWPEVEVTLLRQTKSTTDWSIFGSGALCCSAHVRPGCATGTSEGAQQLEFFGQQATQMHVWCYRLQRVHAHSLLLLFQASPLSAVTQPVPEKKYTNARSQKFTRASACVRTCADTRPCRHAQLRVIGSDGTRLKPITKARDAAFVADNWLAASDSSFGE